LFNDEERRPSLSPVQYLMMVGVGLQYKKLDNLTLEVNVPVSQMLSLFNKCLKKFYNYIDAIIMAENKTEDNGAAKGFMIDNMI